MDAVDQVLPQILQQAGIAGVFALAIWAGLKLGSLWVVAQKDIELARVAVTASLAEALRAQAATMGEQALDIRQRLEAQDIVLRRLSMQSAAEGPTTGATT